MLAHVRARADPNLNNEDDLDNIVDLVNELNLYVNISLDFYINLDVDVIIYRYEFRYCCEYR